MTRSEEPTVNPYQPPAADSASLHSRSSRLLTIIVATLIGVVGGGLTEYSIYVGDPRLGKSGPTLPVTVVGGSLICGILWFFVGTFAGSSLRTLALPLIISLISAGLWVAIGGTYADVLAAASCVGWPLGGLAGAILWRFLRRRKISRAKIS